MVGLGIAGEVVLGLDVPRIGFSYTASGAPAKAGKGCDDASGCGC